MGENETEAFVETGCARQRMCQHGANPGLFCNGQRSPNRILQ